MTSTQWIKMTREQRSAHLKNIYSTIKMDDLCVCGHAGVDHFAWNQMPCTQCECDGLVRG